MKTAWTVISVFVLVHVFASALFVAWLGHSGRLNQQRLLAIHKLFELTVQEEHDQIEEAERIAAEVRQRQVRLARLRAAEDGPRSIESRVENDRQSEAVAMARLERYRADVAALRAQIDQGKQLLATQQEQIAKERQGYLDQRQRQQAQLRSTEFRKTVRMYEQIKPAQVKQLFEQLLAEGQEQRVVAYLAAMNLRKAAKVLSEFKEPQEIALGMKLLEMIREGGIGPTDAESRKKES